MLVFISFDQAGEAIYQALAKSLREVGVEVTAAGRATTSRANKSLQKADALIVLLSAGVLKSPRMRSRALWFHTVTQDHPAKKFIPVWIADGPIQDLWPFLTEDMVMARDIPTADDGALVAQILARVGITPLAVTKPLVATGGDAAPASVARRKFWQLLAVAGLLVASLVGVGVTLMRGNHPSGSRGQVVGVAATPTATFALATSAPGTLTATATTAQGTATATTTSTTQASPSPTSAPTATPTPVPALLALDAGGNTVGAFGADAYFSGGSSISTSVMIDTSKTQHAAPEAVYQTARQGNFTYSLPQLQPGHTYTVRLHFVDYSSTADNMRVFTVYANGQSKLSKFDIFAVAGGRNIATVQEFTVMANTQGQIVLIFERVSKHVNMAVVSGIEIYG